MNNLRFKEVLEEFVVFLYPNFTIEQELDFKGDKYVYLSEDGAMLVKGDLSLETGFKVLNDQPFLPDDEILLSNFIQEVSNIESYKNLKEDYKNHLIMSALNNAITSTLSIKSSDTISNILNALERYSNRTYEGKNISLGVIVNTKVKSTNRVDNLSFDEFINSNYAAVLTNGTSSFIEVDSEGYIIRYLQLDNERNEVGFAPYEYTRILEYAGKDAIALVLSRKSQILIFHNNELKYTKLGERWNPYSHKDIIKLIHGRSENDNLLFARSVYLTALDVSFAQTGGIIAFLNENQVEAALKHINISDIVDEKYFNLKRKQMELSGDPKFEDIKDISFDDYLNREENSKSQVLNKLIDSKKFFQLFRKFREELVGIDGATIIDYNGGIVAIGAILKIEAGSLGGGRLAAARTMSQYGVSIEISSDAAIRGFATNESGISEPIFTISDFDYV